MHQKYHDVVTGQSNKPRRVHAHIREALVHLKDRVFATERNFTSFQWETERNNFVFLRLVKQDGSWFGKMDKEPDSSSLVAIKAERRGGRTTPFAYALLKGFGMGNKHQDDELVDLVECAMGSL